MSDDSNLERELAAFGRTLEQATGEPIRKGSGRGSASGRPETRRRWAVVGAAAATVLALGGLVWAANRGVDDRVEPAAAATTTAVAADPTTTLVPAEGGPVGTTGLDEQSLLDGLGPVPDDPLGLEADGWRLVQRDELPFDFPAELACPGTDSLVELNGAASVRDTLEPPDSTGVDVDVNIIDVGSLDVGNAIADAFIAFGDCVAAEIGTEPEIGAMSSVRASWFRAGPEFAIATIVGEGPRTIVLEIENGAFADELIADLAQRSAAYLNGAPTETVTQATDVPTTTMVLPIEEAAAPSDPLGLEADGWTIVESKDEALSPSFIPGCTGDGAPAQPMPARRDQPVPPTGDGWDIHLVLVPSAGYNLDEITSCYASYLGSEAGIEAIPSAAGAAGWRRLGPDLALAYAVGRDGFGVLIEIKTAGEPFGDEFVIDFVERAVRFLESR